MRSVSWEIPEGVSYCYALAHNAVSHTGNLRIEQLGALTFFLKGDLAKLLADLFSLIQGKYKMQIQPNPNFFKKDFPNFPEYDLLIKQTTIGFWYQTSNIITLSPSWYRIFNVNEDEIFLLEDYLFLIQADHETIRERDSLQSGQRWGGLFTINGISAKSFAIASEDYIIGVDIKQ